MKVCHFCWRWMLTCNCSPLRFSIVAWIRHLWKTTKNKQWANSLHKVDLLIILILLLFYFYEFGGSSTKFIYCCCCASQSSAACYECQNNLYKKTFKWTKIMSTPSLSQRMLNILISTMWTTLLTLRVIRWIVETCLSEVCKSREMFLVFGGFSLLRFSLIVVSSLPASSPPPTCPDSRCVCWAPPLLCCFFPNSTT